jgi:hypothetical protein
MCRATKNPPYVMSSAMRRFVQEQHDADMAAGLLCVECDRPEGSYLHTMPDIAADDWHPFQPLATERKG